MSKDPDNDVAEPAEGKRSRRRRRRNGLRVPSDDVPRQQRQTATTPGAPTPAAPGAVDPAGSALDAGGDREDSPPEQAEHGPGDGAPMIDAIPVYHEDGPAVQARAITQEMLAVSEPEETDTRTASAASAASGRAELPATGPKTVKMTALPFDDMDSIPANEVHEEDSVDIPIEEDEPASPGETVRKHPRAATLALSDEDLEELLEPADVAVVDDEAAEPERPAENLRPAAASGPTEVREADAARHREQPPDSGPAQPAAEPVVAPPAEGHDGARDAAAGAPASGAPESAGEQRDETEAPEHAPIEAPEAPADGSDSGEILEDDMIEEVDEPGDTSHQEARPVPPPAPPKAAPGKPAVKSPPPAPKAGESPPGTSRAAKGKPWFEEIFDEDYLRTLPFLTPKATQDEALFVADALGVEPGMRLLDVGCGYGRHAMELAARGYQIVALDLSLPLLLRGADEAQRRGLSINFVHGDMRELAFESQFDGVYCLFSTFGYFDEENNRKAIEGMARAIKPGSRMVLDVLNRDYLIGDLPTRVWWEGDGCVVLEEVDFNYFSSRVHSNRSVVFDDGRQVEQEISLRAYSLHELGKLLHAAGLRVIEVSGSMATRGRFFGNQSREIIIIAEKRVRRSTTLASTAEPASPDSEQSADKDTNDS